MKYSNFKDAINKAERIVIIQAENPDGDSLGAALALEDLLTEQGKQVRIYCPVDIPKYLRYFRGWERSEDIFDYHADLAIVVDTASQTLLSKTLNDQVIKNFLFTHPVVVIDHHLTETDLPFDHLLISEDAVATCEIIFKIAITLKWRVSPSVARNLLAGISSDTLGFTTDSVKSLTFQIASKLIEFGAIPSEINNARRDLSKMTPEILAYKAKLIEKTEYHLDGRLAVVHVTFEEIQKYSDQYNPGILILDELRMVSGVNTAIVFKTYPDGKITGKIRTESPIAEEIAGFFGGGGHPFAAGFRTYGELSNVLADTLSVTEGALERVETGVGPDY
ncbi:bifunctional oligoribonuclease/PAP phosphatase NrnA [Candidatus Saccharibacteria bacterium]|nr:bifunctional oligoribonuclease/PAP phosphatase NrnA [Candidatus Saccharibacteria bacterium]